MQKLTLKIDSSAYGGISIGRHNGKIVMITGAVLPGETVEVNVENEKRDYLSASAKRVIEPSIDRIEPVCKYFGSCGGCHLQHVPYNLQVQIKNELLGDCLKRLAKIEIDLSESIINDNSWNYRLRGQFKVSRGNIGFYRENTREIIEIDNCPLMDNEINGYLQKTEVLLKGYNIKEIHITGGDSSIALIRTPTRVKSRADWKTLSARFLESGFAGVFVETADKRILQHGKPYTTLDIENLEYTISPMSFFQSHWNLNQTVVSFIKNNLQPLKGKKILDLYSGAGNFSLPLAPEAEVIAVEGNPYAIEDGKRNLKINKIKNCRFIRSSAENFNVEKNINIVILDPPRPGLSNMAMKKVLTLMSEQIVYISCNPATFARDLKKLLRKYDIESIRMIDFFPQTYHIESLAFLRLR
jgi:23S rRNA (uracil1939-C5)-methyltransferase